MKVTIELPHSIKMNTVRTMNSVSEEQYSQGRNKMRDYKKLFFSLVTFHAVVNQREKFGPFGWSKPYQFSANDL